MLGLALYPLVAQFNSGVDILVSGMAAGTIAYGVHMAGAAMSDFIGDWHALLVLSSRV